MATIAMLPLKHSVGENESEEKKTKKEGKKMVKMEIRGKQERDIAEIVEAMMATIIIHMMMMKPLHIGKLTKKN